MTALSNSTPSLSGSPRVAAPGIPRIGRSPFTAGSNTTPMCGPASEAAGTAGGAASMASASQYVRAFINLLLMGRTDCAGAGRNRSGGCCGSAPSASSGGNRPTCGRCTGDSQYDDQLCRNAGSRCAGHSRGNVGLRNGRISRFSLIGSRHPHLQLALHGVGVETPGDGTPLSVGHRGQGTGTAGKGAASSLVREHENHRSARNGLVVLILDLDNGFPGRPLPDVVNGAVALHNHQIELTPFGLGRHHL